MNSASRKADAQQRKRGIIFFATIVVLCVVPIIWEVGLLLTPHHQLEEFEAGVIWLFGGNQYICVWMIWLLISVGLKAPQLVAISICLATAAVVIKTAPRWIKIAVWLPIAAALPAAIFVLRLGVIWSSMYSNAALQPMYKQNKASYSTITSISWCAIQYRQQHSGEGYPSNLDELSKFPCRRKWALNDLPRYQVWYEPKSGDSGRIEAFSVTAYPGDSGLIIYGSDESGLVYVSKVVEGKYYRRLADSHDGTGDYSLPRQQEYEFIWHLYDCLQVFAEYTPERGYPAELKDVHSQETVQLNPCSYPPEMRNIGNSGNKFVLGHYEYTYQPGPQAVSGQRGAFELYAHCLNYSQDCVRNLYANQDSDIHVTPDDRAATLDDPIEAVHVRRNPLAKLHGL